MIRRGGRVVGFMMAMFQRRFIQACGRRRSLTHEGQARVDTGRPQSVTAETDCQQTPENDELPEDEQDEIVSALEDVVASYDPMELQEDVIRLKKLIKHAAELEAREVETKLLKLKETLTQQGVFSDPKMRLLIFTEHKDTLDYLVQKLREWKLTVTQIHGGMKIGDRDTPHTRIYAEREFRESAQVLVATEAAGEGINLQFCWLMINYDIPWNPMRLEQRMGRIHRYGQEKVFDLHFRHDQHVKVVLQNYLSAFARLRTTLTRAHRQSVQCVGRYLSIKYVGAIGTRMYATTKPKRASRAALWKRWIPSASGALPILR